jgi:hypothetical protein
MHDSTITYAMAFPPLRLALPSGADDSVPHACLIQLLVISSSFHSSRPLPSGTIPSTGRLSTTLASRGVAPSRLLPPPNPGFRLRAWNAVEALRSNGKKGNQMR